MNLDSRLTLTADSLHELATEWW